MKTLLMLRHAKSSWADPWMDDHDRPLKARGERDAPRMGKFIRQQELTPDLVITSTAKRARQTAELMVEAAQYDGEVRATRQIYHGDPEDYIEVLQRLPQKYERVMIVGHNPGMEELLELLTGEFERMKTATLAEIRLPIAAWLDLDDTTEGTLVNLWSPREVA